MKSFFPTNDLYPKTFLDGEDKVNKKILMALQMGQLCRSIVQLLKKEVQGKEKVTCDDFSLAFNIAPYRLRVFLAPKHPLESGGNDEQDIDGVRLQALSLACRDIAVKLFEGTHQNKPLFPLILQVLRV